MSLPIKELESLLEKGSTITSSWTHPKTGITLHKVSSGTHRGALIFSKKQVAQDPPNPQAAAQDE